MLCSWPPKLAVANYHLYVWGDQSSARRARPDELLDEDDEDVDDDSQGDWDDEEQDLPLHHLPLVRRRILRVFIQCKTFSTTMTLKIEIEIPVFLRPLRHFFQFGLRWASLNQDKLTLAWNVAKKNRETPPSMIYFSETHFWGIYWMLNISRLIEQLIILATNF